MSQGDDTGSAQTPSILGTTTTTIKFPEFWSADSELWFLTTESIFRKHRITSSQTKFDYVVSTLPQATAAMVRDILRSPPDDQPYEKLREELIRRTTESEPRRLQQLLTSEELGDRKPTEFLRRIEQLLGDKATTIDTAILRELFLQRLPAQVRMILSATTTDSIATLARMADQIMDVGGSSISALEQSTSAPPPTPSEVGAQLTQIMDFNKRMEVRVDQLSQELHRLCVRPSPSPTAKENVRRHQNYARHEPTDSESEVCWYHRRYGQHARQCRSPCTYSGNGMGTR